MPSSPIPLTEAAAGVSVLVKEIEGGHGVQDRLKSLGIRSGVHVVKIADSFAHGPIVVKHGRTQTALGRGICQKILVEVPE